MTNEEIESAATTFFAMQHRLNDDWEHSRALADAMRALVSQAYEEAAKVADEIEDSMAEAIAERIRALKDSLVTSSSSAKAAS